MISLLLLGCSLCHDVEKSTDRGIVSDDCDRNAARELPVKFASHLERDMTELCALGQRELESVKVIVNDSEIERN